METILLITFALLWFKTMFGLHFPWEICDCCGKKWKDHKKE